MKHKDLALQGLVEQNFPYLLSVWRRSILPFFISARSRHPEGYFGVVGGLVGSLLPCRKEDRLKAASLKTCMGKEQCWAATDRAASSEIIPQTKLAGQRPGISPALLEERKPSDTT